MCHKIYWPLEIQDDMLVTFLEFFSLSSIQSFKLDLMRLSLKSLVHKR